MDACEGAAYHSPRPRRLHEVTLRDGSTATVCALCRETLGLYWDLLDAHQGSPPWPLRRTYGNLLRALAERRAI